MKLDYHAHSLYSFDGECPMEEMVAAAAERGLTELCFTDHLDFDGPVPHVPDFAARRAEMDGIHRRFPQVEILLGAEVSLKDDACAARTRSALQAAEPDFVLGSVHTVDGVDVWADHYYTGLSKEVAYRRYLEAVARELPTFPELNVLAHYDFVAKYAPYPDRSVTLDLAPEAFECIFRWLLDHGKGLEINTASWQQAPPWGLDILRRYRELGGEYVTIGSDTHGSERVGARIGEALELARTAGIPCIATFRKGVPHLYKL